MNLTESELIHDWNVAGGAPQPARGRVELDDETLRDGLQSPVGADAVDRGEARILHCMAELGIESANIGLPGAGPHVVARRRRAWRARSSSSKLPIFPNCAARTVEADIRPIVEISQQTGLAIEVGVLPRLVARSASTPRAGTIDRSARADPRARSRFAVGEGLPVMYVTEDTTRAAPEDAAPALHHGGRGRARGGSASPTRSATRRPTARATWCAFIRERRRRHRRGRRRSTGTATTTAAWA